MSFENIPEYLPFIVFGGIMALGLYLRYTGIKEEKEREKWR